MATQGDRVYLALNATETTETKIGTITAPTSGVRSIVGVYGTMLQPTGTNAESMSGYYRLSFKTTPGTFKFPLTCIAGQSGSGGGVSMLRQVIPVGIPFPANETCDIYVAADVALTGTATAEVGLIME